MNWYLLGMLFSAIVLLPLIVSGTHKYIKEEKISDSEKGFMVLIGFGLYLLFTIVWPIGLLFVIFMSLYNHTQE